ncbi:hypothetical protein GCM10010965_03410 [Caldalkalibacillus thermarum]|uniref:flagellar export protein FliJ n=1 Tax=Caldalkalibacillus thermarum TaxID=296745 RepID=UPI001668DBDA|nr:flagellar export protein FliJ [Caldalkalibacillus thermarum]GGK13750.1 hypothetical protein GCM10010965_03410 [Caldalkalibacillus thermarum]
MAPYKFAWQKLLDLNTRQKDQAQMQLVEAMAEQHKLEERLENTKAEIEMLNQQMIDRQQKGTSVASLRQLAEYAHYLQAKLVHERKTLLLAKRRTSHTRQTVVHYMTEEKKWQKLKRKHLHAWIKQERRKEQMATDEIAGRRHRGYVALGSEQDER